jgi:hypothetical protein
MFSRVHVLKNEFLIEQTFLEAAHEYRHVGEGVKGSRDMVEARRRREMILLDSLSSRFYERSTPRFRFRR